MRGDWEPPAFAVLRRAQRDVVSRRQARRHFSPRQIEHRLDSRRWTVLGQGVYLTRPRDELTTESFEWFALLAAHADEDATVCLGGLSALRTWGLRKVEPATVDVVVPASQISRLPRGATLRRTVRTVFAEEARLVSPPATLPGRSLVDAVAWARTDKEAAFLVAAAFQQGIVTLPEVARHAVANGRRHGLLLATARECADGSHTLGELDLLALCRRFRLPLPSRRQVRVVDAEGRERYFDAVYDEQRLAVEVDGAQHEDLSQRWEDAEKEEALELLGYRLLRIPNVMLRLTPAKVARRLRRRLES